MFEDNKIILKNCPTEFLIKLRSFFCISLQKGQKKSTEKKQKTQNEKNYV